MKIAVWHNLPSGGGKRALYNHVKALTQRGHFLKAWTTDASDENYLPLTDFIEVIRKPVRLEMDRINRVKDPLRRINRKINILKKVSKDCAQEIDAGNFDIVLVNSCRYTCMSYMSLFLITPNVIYLGEPFRILFETGERGSVWELPKPKTGIRLLYGNYKDYRLNRARRIQLTEEIKAARHYNRILVNSLFSRESVKRAYGIDSDVCYLGIEQEFFNDRQPVKKNYVVGMGSIESHKNVYEAIEVIAKVPKKIRPPLYWVANNFEPRYFEYLKNHAISNEVEFIPYINISDEEVSLILSQALVMLYIPRLEPFGLAPLEANAKGTFVLGFAEGGLKESIIHGTNGFLANSIAKITEHLIFLLLNPEKASKLGTIAKDFARSNWSFDKLGNNIESELNKLMIGE